MSNTNMPQVLKRLNEYLEKHGLEITKPYDDIKMLDQSGIPCTLCGDVAEAKIYIPNLTCIESRATIGRTVCVDLARCYKRCKDSAEREKAALESRLKAIEEQIVFPEWFGGV